jgi:hypothetical protein
MENKTEKDNPYFQMPNPPPQWLETKEHKEKKLKSGRYWLQISINKFNKNK